MMLRCMKRSFWRVPSSAPIQFPSPKPIIFVNRNLFSSSRTMPNFSSMNGGRKDQTGDKSSSRPFPSKVSSRTPTGNSAKPFKPVPPPSASSSSSSSPRSGDNYFDLLNGGRVEFEVSERALKQTFLGLQQKYHPDAVSSSSSSSSAGDEKNATLQLSMYINRAYQTLRDPILRASYVLELAGMAVRESEGQSMDPAFLMEMLELMESIDECQDSSECERIKLENSSKLYPLFGCLFIKCAMEIESSKTCMEEMSRSFRANDLVGAKAKLIELKYLKNVEIACNSRLSLLNNK